MNVRIVSRGRQTSTKQLFTSLISCILLLSLLAPGGAARVTGDLMTWFPSDVYGIKSSDGELSSRDTGVSYRYHFTRGVSASMRYQNRGDSFFPIDSDGSRFTKTIPVVERVSFKSGEHEFIDLGFRPQRETPYAISMRTATAATDKRFPGILFPSPINESVMLLLLGSGLVLLAGLGMKAYRKLISNL